jgi:hypothetical protein
MAGCSRDHLLVALVGEDRQCEATVLGVGLAAYPASFLQAADGAVALHLRRREYPALAPSGILLVLAMVVAWGRFGPYGF